MPISQDLLDNIKNKKVGNALNLDNLDLQDSDILELINYLPEDSTFISLSFANNQLTSGGAQLIANYFKVTKLDLSNNNIDDVGAKYLSENEFIQWIDLSSNSSLTWEGVKLFLNRSSNKVCFDCNLLRKFKEEQNNQQASSLQFSLFSMPIKKDDSSPLKPGLSHLKIK